VFPAFFAPAGRGAAVVAELLAGLGGPERIADRFGALLVGIPAAHRSAGDVWLKAIRSALGPGPPLIDYRRWVGEFASASAVAVCLAATFAAEGAVPAGLCDRPPQPFPGKGCLVIGLGRTVTAVEVLP